MNVSKMIHFTIFYNIDFDYFIRKNRLRPIQLNSYIKHANSFSQPGLDKKIIICHKRSSVV